MAEALAAIGLAGNIVQFVDFGTKLVLKGQELYQSADGTLKENVELEEITSDIRLLSQTLLSGTYSTALGNAATDDGKAIQGLAKTCSELAGELLGILGSIKIDKKKNRRWESVRKSLQSVWRRREIKDLESRLWKVKEQVCLHLVFLFNKRQSDFLPTLKSLEGRTIQLGDKIHDKVDDLRTEIRSLIPSDPSATNSSESFHRLSSLLTTFLENGERVSKTYHVLESLHFEQIRNRHSDVKDAHKRTFEWIFSQSDQVNFVEWLRSGAQPYWISGKAGCGKSTLMKFLCQDPRTMGFLRKWTGSHTLLFGSHFFWITGTTIQKSQEGLLRTLLFQILSQYPELIPQACPTRWNDSPYPSSHAMEAWTKRELLQTFKALGTQDQLPLRFCFFVDGLDEYDGDPAEIIEIIQGVSSFSTIKFCVSSRPWFAFRDAFGGGKWQLRVQDLTKSDIELYTRENLEKNLFFQTLKSQDPLGSGALVSEIVGKAGGVFLWVFLVVGSLHRGLQGQDDINDLNRRLQEFPADLKAYFKHMFESIESIYRPQTAQIFQLMLHANEPLTLLAYHFFCEEQREPGYYLSMEVQAFSDSDIARIVETRKRQIDARCKDLVEISINPEVVPEFGYTP